MPFNGSGGFTRVHSWAVDKAADVEVTASRMDAEDDGFAAGLSSCIVKDGQTDTTAVIPFAAGINVAATAPASPANGDMWLTTGLNFRAQARSVMVGRELVASGAVAGATNHNLAIPSGFESVDIEIYQIVMATNTATLALQLSTNNGSTFFTTNYVYGQSGPIAGGTSIVDTSASAAHILLCSAMLNTKRASARIHIVDPDNVTAHKDIETSATFWSSTTSQYVAWRGGGQYTGGVDNLDMFKILSSSGNVAFEYLIYGNR